MAGLDRRFGSGSRKAPTASPGLLLDDDDDTYVVDRGGIRHLLLGGGTGFTPGAALELVAGVLSVLVDGVTVTINGDNELVAAGGGGSPSGPAGGALAGTYPDPDLAATLAGTGLQFLANVLSVLVDASTIVINGDGELEVGSVVIQAGSAAGGVLSGTFPDPGFAVDMATQAELDAVSTGLQDAITALAASAVLDGDSAGGVLSGSYPNPGFAVDMATQAELNALAAAAVLDGDAAGGVLSGSYPNPGFAVDMATQAELDALAASKQPLDADLTAIAGLDASAAGAIASDGAGWIKKTYAQLKTALSLGNVDNTSDANKPVSTAQAAADALKFNKALSGVWAYNTANITLTTATWTALTFNSERYDTDNYHDPVTNSGRLVAPVSGYYIIQASCWFNGNAAGLRFLQVTANADAANTNPLLYENRQPNAATLIVMASSLPVFLAAGDYVRLHAYQDSGGNLAAVASNHLGIAFGMHLVGA